MMERLVSALFSLAIHLYPKGFRIRYGPEMLMDLQGCIRLTRETEGHLSALGYLLRALFAVVPSSLRVWREDVRNRTAMTQKAQVSDKSPGKMSNLLQRRESVFVMFSDFRRDFAYGLRTLARKPIFTAAAVLTLALGIGLNTATFTVVNSLLMRPLDGVQEPEELIQIYRRWAGIEYGSVSIPHYQSLRDDTEEIFENVAAWTFSEMAVSLEDRTERLMGFMVSANFFQTYGVAPAQGRFFSPGVEDRDPGAHPVVVLGHGYWNSRFGGDPSVVGTTMTLNGHSFEIVGVAPAEFRGPGINLDAELYAPLMMQEQIQPGYSLIEARGDNILSAVGRVRDGVSLNRVQEFLDAHLLRLREEFPGYYDRQLGTTLVFQNDAGVHPMMRGAQVGMSTVIMVVVSLVLLIACVNVANLFLALAQERRREMGIRLSLGAGGRRLVQQLLTESMVFSLLAGGIGLVVTHLAMGFMARVRPPMDLPVRFDAPVDGSVLLFTLGASLAAGLIFGMAPALQAVRQETLSAVRGESISGAGRSRISRILVILQMALSILLLICSGLFLRSLQSAIQIDPGFRDPSSVAVFSLNPLLQGYEEAEAQEFFDRLEERVEALPGVAAVGMTSSLPFSFGYPDWGVSIPGYEFTEDERRGVLYALISDGYLEALGVQILEGRAFTREDDESGPPVIIVNKRFADRFWPGESALGEIVETYGAARTVVGVVETGKYRTLGEVPSECMYLPQRELGEFGLAMVVRSEGEPQGSIGQVRDLVREMNPDMPVYDVRTMEDHMAGALMPARMGGLVLGAFGILGLLLAAVGVYGVMACSVAQRTRELGIRMALGADRRSVVKMVLGEGMKLAAIGTVLGLAGAAGASHLIQGLLYNTGALDPVAFTGVPATLLAVAALAVYLPARRAASVDPMTALKTD
jgi:predicted permease